MFHPWRKTPGGGSEQCPDAPFGVVLVIFGSQSAKFLEPRNLVNIVVQASSTGIVAVGMTFVLLTAGVRTGTILTVVYLISGLCAAGAAVVSLGQLGAGSPKFGEGKEFAAIAAAVLGGTSLFGGRGSVLPGTLLGVLLIQTIENGLVIVNANPYLYPMITGAVIFVAVLLESLRNRTH